MTAHGFALFDTTIGRCGIAWGARGISGVQLPEASEAKTRARLMQRYARAREAAPPAEVQHAIEAIAALLDGEPKDLCAVALDMDGIAEFDRRVYEAARAIPAGATLPYGARAARQHARFLAVASPARAIHICPGEDRRMNWISNVRPKIRNYFARRDTPENLWIKCPDTGQLVFYKDVEANQFVIPSSNYHMRM